ncbi:MAG: hypothetical protein ACPGQD_03720 [Planctomycetota bacterium]
MRPFEQACRGCGKAIVWGVCEESAGKLPLDASAPVYLFKGMSARGPVFERDTRNESGRRRAMVSHFATCPSANEFSKSGRAYPKELLEVVTKAKDLLGSRRGQLHPFDDLECDLELAIEAWEEASKS